MKIHEILTESNSSSTLGRTASSLPSATVLPSLKNQDAYLQYRFGMAIAAARGNIEKHEFSSEGVFGENMTIVGYTDLDTEAIENALKLMGKKYAKGKKTVSGTASQGTPGASPVPKKQKNKYGV